MSKIVLYSHGGSGNHGCEAIVRGTVKLLNNQVDELYSYRKDEDIKYGLNQLLMVKDHRKSFSKLSFKRILASLKIRLFHDEEFAEKITYEPLFKGLKKGDIALSIGGDNYCYDSFGELELCNKYLNLKGIKTILWGCSVEPSKITERMKKDLNNYSLIVTRESITYNAIKEFHKNVVLYPDPAFELEINECKLPDGFQIGQTIGINVSPVVINASSNNSIVLDNFEKMIEYVLEKTQYTICLIPHVNWEFTNDNDALIYLFNKYEKTGRIAYVTNDLNATELKYIISKCSLFIGSRTHSTIAAYSTCVPTLVLGYSVKAKGIAEDLFGTYDNYVISTQQLKENNELLTGFKWLNNNKEIIRNHLEEFIPEYKNRFHDIALEVEKIKGE